MYFSESLKGSTRLDAKGIVQAIASEKCGHDVDVYSMFPDPANIAEFFIQKLLDAMDKEVNLSYDLRPNGQ